MSDADGLTARAAALAALGAILRRHRPLDEVIDAPAVRALEDRDRGFLRLVLATTLRRLGQIDALLAQCLDRPLPPAAAVVHDILRLGVCQLVFLDTAAHAAVDTSVELAKAEKFSSHKNLVNAVLRRLGRDGKALAAAQDAAVLNTPAWLWTAWTAAYGPEICRAIAGAHMVEPALDISVKADADAWAERLEATLLPTGTLRRPTGGLVGALPGYDEGAWWVQDAAAALPARLLGDVAGLRVLDMCAAPGGKTAQLATAGAEVVAFDRSAARLVRLKRNLDRLRLPVTVLEADATVWRPEVPFDAVLLDAPCSATGTIRRHPDAAWLKTPADVAKLTQLQSTLLRSALAMVKPGGLVVYCVCSLQPEEGAAQVDAVVAAGLAVRAPVTATEVGGLGQAVTPAGDLRTLPHHLGDQGGMDGFFAARLRRL